MAFSCFIARKLVSNRRLFGVEIAIELGRVNVWTVWFVYSELFQLTG